MSSAGVLWLGKARASVKNRGACRGTVEHGCSAAALPMPVFFLSKSLRWTFLLGIALLTADRPTAFSQTTQAQAQATPRVLPGADPTQREAQPRLDVERDPVLSPDPEDNTPGNAGKEVTRDAASNVYTLRQNVDEVLLRCAVVDAKGNLITDLKQGDFRVWEDGAPQTVSSFQHRDQPASIGLLIDNSGSMLDKRGAVNAAALELMKASNPQDSAFVVNFSDRAYLDQGFTSDLGALQRALAHADAKGPTAMYDAVAASANELANHAKWPEQVLVVVTDGRDDASRYTLEQTIHRVQQLGGPVVYSIGLLYEADSKEEAQRERDILETLSAETGGVAYFPRSLEDVNGIAELVARDIRNQYILGYHSPTPVSAGGYRTVRVEAQANGYSRLIVRTRKGYFPKQVTQTPKPASVASSTGTSTAAK